MTNRASERPPANSALDRSRPEISSSTANLIYAGREFYKRNWVLGTSGNFSVLLRRVPFELMITESGAHKGMLAEDNFLTVSDKGERIGGSGKPSAELPIHLSILSDREAGCILHTHSIWSTHLTDVYSGTNGFTIEGYEMLKGLSNVTTHEHREWVPIVENSQHYDDLSNEIGELLRGKPDIHGILLRRHGLYTWGKDFAEAMRHIEVLEFLFEVMGRKHPNGTEICR
ncbi:MAG TPA: methylthioribulose 1-phosphate dehydratase [Candidatus Saccharimonadales bacterium]|nr:methylthioribulose 1-phosphate dehydratase [Candidatus Saccharimonadales bacterium]